jgi:predicted nucleic acid-binding protein
MIVAGSNLIAYLLIPGDKSELADEVLLQDTDWAVPLICRSEIRNILALYMRHEGMSLAQARRTMEKAEVLWSSREFAVPSDDVLELTFHHNITAYDGTFDKPVRKAFPTLAITAEEFLNR